MGHDEDVEEDDDFGGELSPHFQIDSYYINTYNTLSVTLDFLTTFIY